MVKGVFHRHDSVTSYSSKCILGKCQITGNGIVLVNRYIGLLAHYPNYESDKNVLVIGLPWIILLPGVSSY